MELLPQRKWPMVLFIGGFVFFLVATVAALVVLVVRQ